MKSNYTKNYVHFEGRNVNAFSLIYLEYYPAIRQFAFFNIADADAAEDIATDTFLKLFRKDFDKLKSVKVFLCLTTFIACLTYLRKMQCEQEAESEIAYLLSADSPSRYENTTQEELTNELTRLLEKIPGKCRTVCKLILSGLSTREIAKRLGISTKTVQSHKEHAIAKLKELFSREADIF